VGERLERKGENGESNEERLVGKQGSEVAIFAAIDGEWELRQQAK
jgi:hypothetical protein